MWILIECVAVCVFLHCVFWSKVAMFAGLILIECVAVCVLLHCVFWSKDTMLAVWILIERVVVCVLLHCVFWSKDAMLAVWILIECVAVCVLLRCVFWYACSMDLDRMCRCLRAFALCILNRDCLKTYRDTRFLLSMSMVVEPASMCWLGCRGMACHGTAHDWVSVCMCVYVYVCVCVSVCVCVCDLQLLQHHNKISDNHHKTTQISALNQNNSNPNLKTNLSKQAAVCVKQLCVGASSCVWRVQAGRQVRESKQ